MSDPKRLIVDADFEAEDETEDLQASIDAAMDRYHGVLARELSDKEFTIAKSVDGDPARAMAKADRYAQRMRDLDLRRHLILATHAERVIPLDEWRDHQLERIVREEEGVHHQLDLYQTDFHEHERTKAGGIVTPLAHAKLVRKRNPTKRVWDADAALAWQQEHYPQDVTQALSREAAMARLERHGREYVDRETGEVVEFVRDAPPEEPETFKVEQEEETL